MKKKLLDVIFASDKRKNLLILLTDGPQEMEYILTSLNTTRQALLPQMRILEEHNLIDHHADTYELTVIGKLLVTEIIPLLDLVHTLGDNIDYWGTHNLSFIPPHLMERLDELKSSIVFEPDISQIYEINRDFMEKTMESESVTSFTTFLFPNYSSFITEWKDCGVDISLIITRELFDKLRADNYNYLRTFVTERHGGLFVYDGDINVLSFSQNDYCLLFRLFTKDGNFDNKVLVLHGEQALGWGRDLFEYYKQKSVPLTEV